MSGAEVMEAIDEMDLPEESKKSLKMLIENSTQTIVYHVDTHIILHDTGETCLSICLQEI